MEQDHWEAVLSLVSGNKWAPAHVVLDLDHHHTTTRERSHRCTLLSASAILDICGRLLSNGEPLSSHLSSRSGAGGFL